MPKYLLLTGLVLFLLTAGSMRALAQEGHPEAQPEQVLEEGDREAGKDQSREALLNKDESETLRKEEQIVPATTPPPAKNKPKSREDDAVLKFNFLYFVFQKFKIQDLYD